MTLAGALAVFDEAALVVLANKGTVRRAARDVEAGLVAVSAREGDTATIVADGETVCIDARGPAAASCSCPAKGMCRHRIAAVLLLQREAKGDDTAPDEDAANSLLAEIAALPEEALRRFAGRAAWRAALEIAQAGAEIVVEGTAVTVRLAGEPLDIRYMQGLGPDGMISKTPPARRKTLHVAALIAIRRRAGLEPDDVMPAQVAMPETVDPRFLAEVRAALAEACGNALSLAPLALEERLFTLSVSSRADALPRLGALLRGIARMIRERRGRSFRFDPDQCLSEIALADAIARALLHVTAPEKKAALIGSVRQDYAEIGPLALIGMGAESWRAESGGRGVTVFLYSTDEDRWFTVALARGAGQDPDFDPARAYRHEAVWGGTTLARLVGADVVFERVAASGQGRLSIGGSTQPRISAARLACDDWKCTFTNWHALGDRLRERLAGSQISVERTAELVLLQPVRTQAPWLDELTQMLNWPIEDVNGNWLTLTVSYLPARDRHFDMLTALLGGGFSGAILVSAALAGAHYRLRPLALVSSAGICSLDLDPLPEIKEKRYLPEGIRAFLTRRRDGFDPVTKSASMALLDEVVSELTGLAEMGCRPLGAGGRQRLEHLARRAGQSGLDTLSGAIAGILAAADIPSAILEGLYPVHQLRRQLAALPFVTRQ